MPHQWLLKIQENNSRLHKEEIIGQALTAANLGCDDAKTFLYMAWYAYNPYNTYNTKQVASIPNLVNKKNPYDRFFELLIQLSTRQITGNLARSKIEQMAYNFDSDIWKILLRRVILKDLKCGATIKTFNKILKGTRYEIPVFEAQLASDSNKHPQKMKGRKIIEPKLDGIRVLAVVEHANSTTGNRTVKLFSRNGKEFNNFPHIVEELEKNPVLFSSPIFDLKRHTNYVLDGEIISENFQALMTQAQRKTNIDTSDSIYSIFDIIPLEYFTVGKWNVPQRIRSKDYLEPMAPKINQYSSNIQIITGIEVDLDTSEGKNIMNRYFKDQLEKGYEGILIKDVNSPYECKRSTSWLKLKPVIECDLKIVGIEKGTGRNKGKTGALVCKGTDQGQHIEVNVGGGLNDKQREDFWKMKDTLIGQTVTIRADAITQNQNGIFSLRFPRFVCFREDK